MNNIPLAYFEVVAQTKPFNDGSVIATRFDVGMTIQDVIDRFKFTDEWHEHLTVFIEHHVIERSLWGKVRPNSGTRVYIKANAQAPAVALVGAIAGAVAAEAVVTALALTGLSATIVGAIVSGIVTMAVSMVGSALFGPSAPSDAISSRSAERSEKESQTYSITSARNRLAPFDPVPVVLGTHKMVPPYGAAPYTEVAGGDQYLRIVVLWGYGPVAVSDVKIGNTPIEDFTDVFVENDFIGDSSLSLYPKVASQESLSITLNKSFQSRQTERDVDEFGITLTWPNGLVRFDGLNREKTAVAITAEYKLESATEWTTWFSFQFIDDTAETKRYSTRLTGIPRGTYDVRILSDNLDQTGPEFRNLTTWTALRSFRNENPINLSGIAKSSYRIKATDQLNGVIDQLNAVVSLNVPIWDGAQWVDIGSTSNNPAAIYRYILTGAPNANALTSSRIDNTKLGEWYVFCEQNGFTFNSVIDYRVSVRELLQNVAAAGRASPTRIDDKWSVIIDTERTIVRQLFTPRNTSNFSSQIQFVEIPHAFRCRFLNEDKGFREDERIVYDDGYSSSNATKFELLELAGQTNPANVYKLARYYLAGLRLRPEIFSFDCDFEGLIATRGDLIKFAHDVPLIGQAYGRIKSINGNVLTLDEKVIMESGKSYSIYVRENDGEQKTHNVVLDVGEKNSVTVTNASGITAGDLFSFGETDEEVLDLIIVDIEAQDDLRCKIKAVPYSPEIFNSANIIPPYNSVLSEPVSASFVGPDAPVINNVISDESALVKSSQGSLQPGITVYASAGSGETNDGTITKAEYLQARFKRSGSDDPYKYTAQLPVDSGSLTLQPVYQGEGYDIEVRAIGKFGDTSKWTKHTNHVVLGAIANPTDLSTLTINSLSEYAYLEWTYTDIPIDVVGYEVRYHPDQNVTEWRSMTVMSDSIPRDARSVAIPSRKGSYGIKAIDVLGNRSVNALFVNSSLEDPNRLNIIEEIVEDPAFNGIKTNVDVVNNSLQLSSSSVMADWENLTNVVTMTYGTGQGFVETGYYEFGEFDIGGVFTSRVTANLDVSTIDFLNVMSTWTTLSSVTTLAGSSTGDESFVELQIAYSIDDVASGQVYSDWRRFVVGDYTARWVKFRAVLKSTQAEIGPSVKKMSVNIDMPDRIYSGEDISSGLATKSISFSPYYKVLKSVNVSAQNMQTGDFYTISNKSRSGFDITFYNSVGSNVDRTFDFQAVGYGNERAT